MKLTFLGVIALIFLYACNNAPQQPVEEVEAKVDVPVASADSAYKYTADQLAFGPRISGTKANKACDEFLKNKLAQFGFESQIQYGKMKLYNGELVEVRNIIGSFKPETNNRILLCSHWDSRPFADHDLNPVNRTKPVPGANDGAAGVGILLEIARQIQLKNPTIGVDIMFWDAEDYGAPQGTKSEIEDDWALGAQYWAKNKHKPNYFAKYGILLDMVGGANPTFYQEQISMQYAPDVVRMVWQRAAKLGYQNIFLPLESSPITDDHLYINTIAGIPTIDIIHRDVNGETGFYPYWHTVKDDLAAIDKKTLAAVTNVLMNVIYYEK